MKIEVIRAWPQRFEAITLTLPPEASVADAVAASGMLDDAEAVAYAVHGQRVELSTALRDGDRVELLRPLQADPKEARRRRARSQKTP